jgi:nucleoside-diphosphate-sugar epimerase
VERVEASLANVDRLREAMSGVDVVFHLAGEGSPASPPDDVGRMVETNVTGTFHVLRAASDAGVRRVVFASSAAVYGEIHEDPKREEMTPQPASPYAVSKLAGEQLCTMFHRRGELETVVLRLFNVYGPGQDQPGQRDKFIPRCMASARDGQPIPVRGDGEQTRDYVHVDDVVDAFVRAADRDGAGGQVINVGSGQPLSVLAVIRIVAAALGVEPAITWLPSVEGEVRHATAECRRMRALLGMSPTQAADAAIARLVHDAPRERAAAAQR